MRQGILCTILGIFLLKPVVCWLNKEKYQAFTPWPHVWLHVYCCSQVNLPPLFLPSSHALLPFSTPHLPPFLFLPPPFFSISVGIPQFTGNSLGNSREFPMIALGIPQFMGIPGNSQCYQIITCLFAMHDYFLIIICKQTA